MILPDPRQLRYFLAVVEKGSLSGAAEALNISEPALSKSIRLLEQSLKVQLLERHSRGMVPTVFGRALAERPGLRVSVYEALADKMMPMTLSGDLDFCVMTMRPFQLDPGLQQEPLL